MRLRESFRARLVGYMDKESTRKELVDVLKVFSPTDFETVWDAVRGHAGSLDMVFQDARAGSPLSTAIETACTFT